MGKRGTEIFGEAVRNRLFRFAAAILGNRDDAEDAVHDVLEKLWRRRNEMPGMRAPESFALSSVRNLCIDRMRTRRDTDGELPDRPGDDPTEAMNDADLIRKAIARLPERQREVIHLKDIEGCTDSDVSQITGIPENQVRVYLSRSRRALRRIVEELMETTCYEN